MTPAALLLTLVLCGVVMFASRRAALLAVFIAIFLLSYRGGISLGGLRMHPGRFLELAGFARVFLRGELRHIRFGRLDRMVLLTYGFLTLVFLLRTFADGGAARNALVTPMAKIGELVDIALLYFMFRALLTNMEDLRWLLGRCVVVLVPVVLCLVVERVTSRNPLAFLGANPGVWLDFNDDFRIRCFGAFAHPGLLGTAGAWLAVTYVALALSREDRVRGGVGFVLAAALIIFASSGGPITSLMAGLLGWGFWLLRDQMRMVRWGILGGFVLLALTMKDPIWYLPSKMSALFGGGGWHRSFLMSQAITNIDQWWLVGMRPEATVTWFPYAHAGGGSADITNLYVAFGVDAGLVGVILLVWLLVVAFGEVGRMLRGLPAARSSDRFLAWALGCGVLLHAVNYLSITYFDQTQILWLFLLAAIASVAGSVARQEKPAATGQPAGRFNFSKGGRQGVLAHRRRHPSEPVRD